MLSNSLLIIMSSIAAMLTTTVLIPAWIRVCAKWNLFEKTDDRKRHKENIPTMGGISIFAGIAVSFLAFVGDMPGHNAAQLVAGMVLLFFTGFFDDLIDLKPSRKLVLQFVASILVILAGFRIESLYGFCGIGELPDAVSWMVTIVFIIAVTNALNLIDGLDGLAGSLMLMSSMIFGILFLQAGDITMAMLSFSICGAVFGFLIYNFHPAKIFMGDSGSLVLGFLLSVQAIALFQHFTHGVSDVPALTPALIAAVLFVPLYDVLRVSVIRIITGYSPFHPDRNHVHHMMVGQGFGQRMTTVMIAGFNLMYVGIAILFPKIDMNSFIILSVCLGMLTMNTLSMSWLALLYGRMGGRLYDRAVKA
jgi:UDP-N-acetylmuramyl pentapeptide phosphotransferase/UDP-N-acetylglucosamine-1-phosphate transferase